jgi:hypothetical protein
VPLVVDPSTKLLRQLTFANAGSFPWVGDHQISVRPPNAIGAPSLTAPPAPVGSAGAPINPLGSVSIVYEITAPSQPGTYDLGIRLTNAVGQVLASAPAEQIVVRGPPATFDNALVVLQSAPSSIPQNSSTTVFVLATNTGSTTWWPPATYGLTLQRTGRIALPRPLVPIPRPVSPNGSIQFVFGIECNGNGEGSFTAQMSALGGGFGQSVAANVVCP